MRPRHLVVAGFLSILATGLALHAGPPVPAGTRGGARLARHAFGWQGQHFLLDGQPFVIISGEMHYPRVPRAYWRDRMRKMKAMGLNTLCTYVFWNLHEPEPGRFDFSGNLDVAAFVKMAQEEGLWVIVRPGPYICTEWDFGGLPWWLHDIPGMVVRSASPPFLQAAARYMAEVGKVLAPLQVTRGGPIIMAQVENEYGSYGDDQKYLAAIRDTMRASGFDVTLFTSDGDDPSRLAAGSLPDVLSVVNFGAGSAEKPFAAFAAFRREVPLMCGEYWVGWFDHWGEQHHAVTAARASEGLEWMLSRGISVNLYMVHGGSTGGAMAGANDDETYQPDISNYDYDSPLDEAGRPTAKFRALQSVIARHRPAGAPPLPALPAPSPIDGLPEIRLGESAPLIGRLAPATRGDKPSTMETLGQGYGFVLYRHRIETALKGRLQIAGVHDYAIVFHGGRRLGVVDRRLKPRELDVHLSAGAPLDILVEHMGRTNFGARLASDVKGITGGITLDGKLLSGWESYPIPLTVPAAAVFSVRAPGGPAFYRASFDTPSPADTFLDLRNWGKGYVWVNGHNLGRYWRIGPQQSLFLPGTWLKPRGNEIVVLDLEDAGSGARTRTISGTVNAIWETR